MSPPLIVLVDDDSTLLEATAAALRTSCSVCAFSSATAALDALDRMIPDAIISDIVMPGIGGFEFRRLYAKRFDDRRTPFLFLTSLGDPETTVAGLDAGADDVLVKPVPPEVLRARVRALLRRRGAAPAATFSGDLDKVPFIALLQWCEAKGLTGELVVESGEIRAVLPLKAGELDAAAAAPWLDRLCDLTQGTFLLRSAPVDLRELAGPPSGVERDSSAPAGKLSTISVQGRLLRVQTELVPGETTMLVSLVLAGGEPLAKLRRAVPAGADAKAVQRLIDEQHTEAEAAMHDRVSAIRHKWQHGSHSDSGAADPPSRAEEPPAANTGASSKDAGADGPARAALLFDEGYEHYRRRDYRAALACWERGLELDPESRTLAINIGVAKRKLQEG